MGNWMGKYPRFLSFCYYTEDLLIYNILLLWILSPLSSIGTQFLIFIIFIINIAISLQITNWIESLWKENITPAVPIPVVFVSAYSIILHFVIEN